MRVEGVDSGGDLRELCMAKAYRPVLRDQVFLLPPDMRDWLPADHLVWFLLETIEVLDTSEFDRCRRRGGVGAAGYDPRMLLGLLVYAYCRGIRSSRQIERLCSTDVAFRVLCAQDIPDHCTIARFRVECQDAFTGLFMQVLMIAGRAGLGQFGTVAIDGTKIAANASIDANRGHEWLSDQVTRMITEAEQADAAENSRDAGSKAKDEGDRVPAQLIERNGRAQRIREAADEVATQVKRQQKDDDDRMAAARARLVKSQAGEQMVGRIPDGPHRLAEARAHLAREAATQQAKLDRRAALLAAGKKPMGTPPVPLDQHSRIIRARRVVDAALAAEQVSAATKPGKSVLPKTVANITDPQSRLMPTRKGFLQGYNAQFAVTADQIIVAAQIGQSPNDMSSFVPMMEAARQAAAMLHAETDRPEHIIGVVLADAGYCSDRNLATPGPERLIALTKARDHTEAFKTKPVTGPPPPGATPRQAMSHRLRTPEGSRLYKRRGATVEPGIGNLKKILDRFSRRGLDSARSELDLAVTAFNLMKIHRATAA
jgi:transposase